MKFQLTRFLTIAAFGVASACVFAADMRAQEAPVISRDELQTETPGPHANAHAADGERHGLPAQTVSVVPGTRFLVRLGNRLNTRQVHKDQPVHMRTVEPLV